MHAIMNIVLRVEVKFVTVSKTSVTGAGKSMLQSGMGPRLNQQYLVNKIEDVATM